MTAEQLYDALIQLITLQIEDGVLPTHLKQIKFHPDLRLNDLGLDSISKVGLLASLMDETDCYFPDNLFLDNPTLQEITERAVKEMSS